jgi:hypothetical protein
MRALGVSKAVSTRLSRELVELGVEPRVEVRGFSDRLLEKRFVVEVNLRRRHLNDFQRAEPAYPLLEIESLRGGGRLS